MLYICLGNSDGGTQIREVVATNLAARLRRKGGLLTGDKYRNRVSSDLHCSTARGFIGHYLPAVCVLPVNSLTRAGTS